MEPSKRTLTEEKETLLITLFAKAGESRLPDSLLSDTFAAEAVRRIDYDFARLKVTRDMMVGLAMRARMLDDWVRAFIAESQGDRRHPALGDRRAAGAGDDAPAAEVRPGSRGL